MSAETLVEALAEIDRLRGAIKAAYHEGAMFESRGDLCWDDSDAKAAIWSTAGSVDSEALVEALVKAGVVDAGWFNEATDAGTLLRISARFASPEAKREVLAALIGEPDLFWSQSNNEVGLPSVSEAADFCEMDAGGVQEFDVAKTLGKRWVAMLPTDFERDDGYVDGIGWLDGEAVLFDTEAEADAALADRKASLLAPLEAP